ncbi:MAG: Bug family tripartite tricarboxylate transporter substrate binding protein [Xanthobacteraceae bacterium]
MAKWHRAETVAGMALGALLATNAAAFAQSTVAEFYKGKSIHILVGSSAGGGYDTYARAIARHMGKYIPGHPTFVPQNMPGAGGNKAAGYLYSVAPKDGTAIGALFPGSVVHPLLSDAPIQHDPGKLIYLGSANSDVYVCVARTDAPVKSLKDLFSREMIIGASNQGGTSRDMPTLSNNVLGTKFRIVTGYAGMREITLALERKEIQGICGFGYSSLLTTTPHWLSQGIVRILVQENAKGMPALNKQGIPRTVDFTKNAEDRQILELVYAQAVFGRPFALPPGVPPDRVAALRKAFTDTLADKEFLADAKRIKLEIEAVSGTEMQAMVERLFALPKSLIARTKQSLVYKPQAK